MAITDARRRRPQFDFTASDVSDRHCIDADAAVCPDLPLDEKVLLAPLPRKVTLQEAVV